MTCQWLESLLCGNDDEQRLSEVMAARNLTVSTQLDDLREAFLNPEETPIRAALLIAHAGDGKSHFIRSLEEQYEGAIHRYPEAQVDLSSPGLHVLNDPSQISREEGARFIAEALGSEYEGCVYVASANRGLLRDLLAHIEDGEVHEWIQRALDRNPDQHHVDKQGRVAIPLDLRTLVPAPGAEDQGSGLARELAHRVLVAAHEEGDAIWDPGIWSERVAVTLALVEASGHHVTFREVISLSAAVALDLLSGDEGERKALATLFMEDPHIQALTDLVRPLSRLDPARVATPMRDRAYSRRAARDRDIRAQSCDGLVELFRRGETSQDLQLPFRFGVDFLRLCSEVAQRNRELLQARESLNTLLRTSQDLDALLGDARQKIRVAEVPFEWGDSTRAWLFKGLSRVAWGGARMTDQDAFNVLPLAAPLQPGTVPGKDGWRMLRAAIGLENARFAVEVSDPGPFIECGLIRPELRLAGPPGLPVSPPLHLDLELFEALARIGQGARGDASELGARRSQVDTWLDGLTSRWEQAWSEKSIGFVAYKTLIGNSAQQSVALRPPKSGMDVQQGMREVQDLEDGVLEVLLKLWPYKAQKHKPTLAVTPAGVAAGLLLWAGIETPTLPEDPSAPGALREALGAGAVGNLRRRTSFISPAFPWSQHTLGLGVVPSPKAGAVATIDAGLHLTRLGAAVATSLNLDQSWKALLAATWAEDEEILDDHPASRLAHQWLQVGAAGRQLDRFRKASVQDIQTIDTPRRVLNHLLSNGRGFSRTERWWLVGTWGAWWLMLRAIQEIHGFDEVPLFVPRSEGEMRQYKDIFRGWLNPGHHDRDERFKHEAVCALAQASGFITPPSLPRNIDLALTSSGGLADLVRILAWDLGLTCGRKQEQTVDRLTEELFHCGLFVRQRGDPVRHRLPSGVIASEAPSCEAFHQVLRESLTAMSLLDTASDGASLIRSPWLTEEVYR